MNKIQVLLYTSYLHVIGGIETFVESWVSIMRKYYDIGLYCPQMPPEMTVRMSQTVPVFTNNDEVECDTLIMIRMMDKIPKNVKYQQSVRMCHACKTNPSWKIEQDCDVIVHVSEASKKSFGTDGKVILNPVVRTEGRALLFVSATRIPATDKGKNADRMIKLATMLNKAEIPFIWLNFSDSPLDGVPKGMVNVGKFHNMQPYISRADYLVQLSDQEGFGYSVAEALVSHTAVICTPFATTKELGIEDGVNGYIVPYDMNFDVHKLLNVPAFAYKYDNANIIKAWRRILGGKKPKHDYIPPERVEVEVVIQEYRDMVIGRVMKKDERLYMPYDRALMLQDKGFVKISKDGTK